MSKLFFSFMTLIAALAAQASLQQINSETAPFKLPALPYKTSALQPVIDTETMKIHHGLHHKGYVDNLNKAIDADDQTDLKSLLANVSTRAPSIRNNGGGHWNHSFFWTVLTGKKADREIPADLKKELETTFGSFEKFQEAFEKQGISQFGSGWAWLIRNAEGKLEVTATPNQDNPLMDVAAKRGTPILGIDVWEHAYYLKYQNKRANYLKNFWKIVNWKQVAAYDSEAKAK